MSKSAEKRRRRSLWRLPTFDEAVASGVLVDLTREAQCCWRVAMTSAAYEDTVAWTDADGGMPWRQRDRWAHLQVMLFYCVAARGDKASRAFHVLRAPRGGGCGEPCLTELRMHVVLDGHQYDDALVVSLPEEPCPVAAR